MKCPLCEFRRAKRFCPAKATQICPVCCGTKREVEIDCPSDCVYLQEGREYESKKNALRGQWAPRTERLWEEGFIDRHYGIFLALWRIILEERNRFPELVDSDIQVTLDSLIQTYETLEKGIYYDSSPKSTIQRSLYSSLKSFLETSEKEFDVSHYRLKTDIVLDCLRFQKELAESFVLPRPKSRAFLDHLEKIYSQSVPSVQEAPKIILPGKVIRET